MRWFVTIILSLSFIAGIAQSNPREVMAREGDGIYSLLRRYGLDSAHYVRQFITINEKALGKNHWLYPGKTYLLPVDPKNAAVQPGEGDPPADENAAPPATGTFAIFGPAYSVTPVTEQTLQGAVFYIIPGHGGPDPGAEGHREGNTLCEDEYAYDIALRLCRELISRGAKAYMIVRDSTDGIRDEAYLKCDADEFCIDGKSIPRNHLKRLQQRVDIVNRYYKENGAGNYQRIIEIHIDSRHRGERVDVFFYHHSKSSRGTRLAERIHANFQAMYDKHQPERGYQGTVSSRDGLYMVSNTIPPEVYIELGNIQNEADQLRFIRYENRQALAKWICEGAVTDYKAEKGGQ